MTTFIKSKFLYFLITVFLTLLSGFTVNAQIRTIHVFVSLCDNVHQGIVPVPAAIGNGKDPENNMYWGAMYGVKSFFKNKPTDWKLLSVIKVNNPVILERLLFKHATKNIYMLADAYDGEKIKRCIEDFLKCSNAQLPLSVNYASQALSFGGGADLLAYVGHDGLMDFDVKITYNKVTGKKRDVIILACYSKLYFSPEIRKANATPVLWTTHLMAPEAYTLKAALDGWMLNESGAAIKERAAQTYNSYQKCGINGARNLFTTGF